LGGLLKLILSFTEALTLKLWFTKKIATLLVFRGANFDIQIDPNLKTCTPIGWAFQYFNVSKLISSPKKFVNLLKIAFLPLGVKAACI